MTAQLLAFCEAPADHHLVERLVDLVASERAPGWLRDLIASQPEAVRTWTDERPTVLDDDASESRFIAWKNLRHVRTLLDVRPPIGKFAGEKGKVDAAAARTALAVCRALHRAGRNINAVVLMRDADDQPERRDGLQQARAEAESAGETAAIVVGVANPNREAWILSAFDPENEQETSDLQTCRREIGFDPRLEAHRLRAKQRDAKTSAKRIVWVLTRGSREREDLALERATLPILEERGANSGLGEFLTEIEVRLLPVLETG